MRVRLIVVTRCCERLSVRRCAPTGAGRAATAGRGYRFRCVARPGRAALTSLQQSREARVASVATAFCVADSSSTGQECHCTTGVVGEPLDGRLVKRFQLILI